MATPFSRTLHELEADRSWRQLVTAGVGALFLLAWLGWFVKARVPSYVEADTARLEVISGVFRVEAPRAGLVTASRLQLAQTVVAGQVLLELDATKHQLERRVENRQLKAMKRERAALQRELKAAEKRLSELELRTQARLSEAGAGLVRLEAEAALAAEEAERASKLAAAGLLSSSELAQRQMHARRTRGALQVQRQTLEHVKADHRVQRQNVLGDIAEIEGRLGLLDIRMEGAEGRIEGLRKEEEELLRIRAPVDGRVGELATLKPGAVLEEGDFIASIVPDGRLHAIAHVRPREAVGRIRVGQRAWVRPLEPPTLRRLPARVTRVGNEPRAGSLRVELALQGVPTSALEVLPQDGSVLGHGLPVAVEIEVERVAPMVLVFRAVGRELLASADAGPKTEP